MPKSAKPGEPTRFPPVRSRILREQIVEPIRNAILFGEMRVGQRLTETDLATQMKVSRIPIREALRQLEHEGLVESAPHRGTVVAAPDETEVDALYHLRAELEASAIVAAMARSQTLGGRLRSALAAMSAAAESGDLVRLAETDVEFHRLIVLESGYRILGRVWAAMDGPVRARMHRLFRGPFVNELVWYTASSHDDIVAAVEAGDAPAAAEAVRRHVLETRELAQRGVRP